MKILFQQNLDNNILDEITKVSIENTFFLRVCANFSKNTLCANFTIEIIGNETGHLPECVELFGKFINMNET